MEIYISDWIHKFQNKTGLDAKVNLELYKSKRVCSVLSVPHTHRPELGYKIHSRGLDANAFSLAWLEADRYSSKGELARLVKRRFQERLCIIVIL
jgi:hypothetical protein